MKKERMEKNMSEDIIEIDRMLLAALKRNLEIARRVSVGEQDEKQKEAITHFLNRHILLSKKRPAVKKVPQLTEGEKKLHKFSRYMVDLTEGDMENLLVLVKSMHQRQRGGVPATSTTEAKGSTKKNRMPPGVKVESGGEAPTSDAA